jgi:hypothetical protein
MTLWPSDPLTLYIMSLCPYDVITLWPYIHWPYSPHAPDSLSFHLHHLLIDRIHRRIHLLRTVFTLLTVFTVVFTSLWPYSDRIHLLTTVFTMTYDRIPLSHTVEAPILSYSQSVLPRIHRRIHRIHCRTPYSLSYSPSYSLRIRPYSPYSLSYAVFTVVFARIHCRIHRIH